MSTLVESLKRLFKKGTLTLVQMKERVQKGTISEDEFKYITGKDYSA
ncbi:MAG: XkdX family protein [Lachnospiraceae bacterium]|nr:XkdX family protein [Lachnospiraceae bacterium]